MQSWHVQVNTSSTTEEEEMEWKISPWTLGVLAQWNCFPWGAGYSFTQSKTFTEFLTMLLCYIGPFLSIEEGEIFFHKRVTAK